MKSKKDMVSSISIIRDSEAEEMPEQAELEITKK